MMRSLSALLSWLLRAWPVLSLVPIALAHATAHRFFPADTLWVNRITGTALQVAGGLIVLYSVNMNLGLFRDQHFGHIVIEWFRSCPLLRRSVTISLSASGSVAVSGIARVSVCRVTNTLEEKIAELERQLDEFRQHVKEDIQAVNTRIDQVHTELSTAVTTNTTTLNQVSSRLELATIGGIKQQAFGVFLAVYGAITSVFA